MSDQLKFFHIGDHWGYTTDMGHYYFESKNGDMLFGDGLPGLDDEKQARVILRAANIAHDRAKDVFNRRIQSKMKELLDLK